VVMLGVDDMAIRLLLPLLVWEYMSGGVGILADVIDSVSGV
jgi:hypothetical protein